MFTLIFIFFSQALLAQSEGVVSLIDELNEAETDSARIYWYNYISFDLRQERYYDKALQFADSALAISIRKRNYEGIATAYSRLGDVYDETNKKDLAISYYDSSYRQSEAIGFIYGQARAANQLTLTLYNTGNYLKAIDRGRIAVKLLDDQGLKQALSSALNNLANAFSGASEFDSSISYFNRSLDLAISLKDTSGIADVYLNLGVAYEGMENFSRALEYGLKGQSMAEKIGPQGKLIVAKALSNQGNALYKQAKFDEAEKKYLTSLSIKDSLRLKLDSAPEYNNLGNIYMARKDWRKAETYFSESYDLWQKSNSPNSFIALTNLAKVEKKQGRLQKALGYYLVAYDKIDSLGKIKSHPEVLDELAELYQTQGNIDKALLFSRRYSRVKRDIGQELIRVGNLERDIEASRNELTLLEEQSQRFAAESDRQMIFLIALVIVLVLVVMVVFILNRNNKLKAQNLIGQKNQAQQNEKINTLIKNQEISTINARMEGQEKERTRIARELHDRLGGMLSIVKLNFQSFEESIEALKEKNVQQYQQANEMLDEACEEVRKIALDMTSGVLVKFGIMPALNDLKTAVEKSEELSVNLLDFGLDERLDYDLEINIYRIIQELLTNTLKHAKATEMNIQILKKDQGLSIVVDDDGVGFDLEAEQDNQGMGLDGIRSRVAAFSGHLEIDSGKGAGTTVTIDLQLKKETL